MIKNEMNDEAILRVIGERISRHRLRRNLTQDALAEEAGVSRPTVQRLEQGASIQFAKLIRVLRALQLLEGFDAVLPDIPISPLQQLKYGGQQRRRASSSAPERPEAPWSWGDES